MNKECGDVQGPKRAEGSTVEQWQHVVMWWWWWKQSKGRGPEGQPSILFLVSMRSWGEIQCGSDPPISISEGLQLLGGEAKGPHG